jgi:hypothetical protein
VSQCNFFKKKSITNPRFFLYLAQRSKATCADAPGLRKDDRLEEKRNLIKIIFARRKIKLKKKKKADRNRKIK